MVSRLDLNQIRHLMEYYGAAAPKAIEWYYTGLSGSIRDVILPEMRVLVIKDNEQLWRSV